MTQTATQQTQAEKIQGLIQEFSKDRDIIEAVRSIEARPATTQDRYADYMAFLTPYTGKQTALYVISQAMILAGGNRAGISWAIRILTGN